MAEWHLRGDGELKTVLITGGAGFIGSVPVRLLVQKTDARGLVKTVPSWAPGS
jgi:nucleoside-diphosphate-sugar epimerase